jgi:hypothetical protein
LKTAAGWFEESGGHHFTGMMPELTERERMVYVEKHRADASSRGEGY